MEPFVRRFLRSSLIWLGIGVLLGVSMVFWPAPMLGTRTAHLHANLLGFVSMMIFGVAYHVVPRFTGNALRSRRMAEVHLWVANIGLALLVVGWAVRGIWQVQLGGLLHGGATLSAVGAALFIYNIWRTLGPVTAPAPALTGLRPVAPGQRPAQR